MQEHLSKLPDFFCLDPETILDFRKMFLKSDVNFKLQNT
jgi:hypothetical protein